MYYYRNYAFHGTYWDTNFGQPMGRGWISMRTEDAKWLFDWADPSLPAGASEVRSSDANPGTLVVIHQYCLVNYGSATTSLPCDRIPPDLLVN